jgi:hypothetical protein
MGKIISYKDVPVFANFTTEARDVATSTSSHLFAASDVSINLTPNLTANRYLGKTQSRNDFSVTGPLEAKISMTFFPIVEKLNTTASQSVVNTSVVNQLAFFNTSGQFTNGHAIQVGNYFFWRSYLQNYSVKINAFQPVSVTANFISYDIDSVTNLEFSDVSPSAYLPIAKDSSKPHYKVLHGLASIMQGSSNFLPTTKTNVEVNVDCQRTPVYTLGSRIPSSVVLTSVERTTTVQGEGVGLAVNISGANAGSTDIFLTSLDDTLSPSLTNHILRFDINGRIISQDISVSQGNMVNGRVVIKEIIL